MSIPSDHRPRNPIFCLTGPHWQIVPHWKNRPSKTEIVRFRRAFTLAGIAILGFLPGCDSRQVTGGNQGASSHQQDGTPSNRPIPISSHQLTDEEPGPFADNELSLITHEDPGFRPQSTDGDRSENGMLQTPQSSQLPTSQRIAQRTSPVNPVSLASTATARQWLDLVIDRYQRADRYSDRGYVRLVYRRLGERYEDKAPLSVSFVRGRALHLQAYAADIVVWQGRFQAAVTDSLTNNFDSQIVDRTVGSSGVSLAEIYSDPELTHFASAGLGGPSPQLELLLSDKPLAGLFEGSAKLTLGDVADLTQVDPESGSSQTFRCQKIAIDSDTLQYQLWIDKDTGLLRRIELPPAAAGLDVDPSVTEVKLSIEIDGARFGTFADESFKLPAERLNAAGVKRLRAFVPLPPPIVSDLLGRRTPEFALSKADGNLLASERGSDRAITVLLWIADHPASRMAASQLQIVADARENAGNKDSRIVIVMAEPRIAGGADLSDSLVAPQSVSTTGALLRSWRVGLPFADDFKAVGRDVFKIAEAPTLVVLGPSGLVEWYQPRVGPDFALHLPMLLDDLAKGKEVGKEIRSRYDADQQTYKRLLAEAASQ